jgi:hypothetical protein
MLWCGPPRWPPEPSSPPGPDPRARHGRQRQSARQGPPDLRGRRAGELQRFPRRPRNRRGVGRGRRPRVRRSLDHEAICPATPEHHRRQPRQPPRRPQHQLQHRPYPRPRRPRRSPRRGNPGLAQGRPPPGTHVWVHRDFVEILSGDAPAAKTDEKSSEIAKNRRKNSRKHRNFEKTAKNAADEPKNDEKPSKKRKSKAKTEKTEPAAAEIAAAVDPDLPTPIVSPPSPKRMPPSAKSPCRPPRTSS